MLTKLIPAQYRWLAWLALAAIIASAGAWGGHKATQAYYQPKIEKLETRAKVAEDRANEFEAAYNALAGATQRQNEAINQLQDDAKAREKRAAKELAQARAAAIARRGQAAAIMDLKLPAGADECLEAQAAFDEELRQERGR